MTSQWKRLTDKAAAVQGRSILDLFDNGRAATFSARLDDMLFDYSKTNIDRETLDLLLEIAKASDVAAKRDAMFAGARINETEGRAVLHTALRAPPGAAPPSWLSIQPGEGIRTTCKGRPSASVMADRSRAQAS